MASTKLEVRIRRARPDEADTLTALIVRAKSYWGYDQSFIEACRPLLTLTSESIERDPVYCAEVGETVVGVNHLKWLNEQEVCLEDLFVEPAFIGQGIGRLLWHHAVGLARTMGAGSLVLEADPHARPFYEHMGAVVEGHTVSTKIPGRSIPHMRYE